MAVSSQSIDGKTIYSDSVGTDGIDIEIDYSSQFDRIATALETIAANSTEIKNSLTTIATQTTTIAGNQTTMADKITSIENKALNDGIRIAGPYEWLSMSSLLRLYDEQGVDINRLKQEFLDRISREF